MNVTDAIGQRKSIRKYSSEAVTSDEINKLVWAGKQAPCAGGIRSLEFSIVMDQNKKNKVYKAALKQAPILNSSALIIISANYEKNKSRYNKRGRRYTILEAGHAAQNIYLMATSLGLGTVAIGAFKDRVVKATLGIDEDPLYIMPVGRLK